MTLRDEFLQFLKWTLLLMLAVGVPIIGVPWLAFLYVRSINRR